MAVPSPRFACPFTPQRWRRSRHGDAAATARAHRRRRAARPAAGTAAVQAIRALRPDLVFLDVQMPGMSGLDVIRELGPDEMPATVLVTAYDRHALEAFELAAVDYVVKPFDDE